MRLGALPPLVVTAALALTLAACSGEKKLGEACEEAGKTEGECEAGGVCGKQTSGSLQCLKTCSTQTDCPAEQECNGVEGSSLKGCRLKSGASSGGADAGKK